MGDAKNKMTELEIAGKLRLRKTFTVPGQRERKMAYACSKFLGIEISTNACNNPNGFEIKFVNGGAK